jgi:hypothetical protein
MFTGNNRKAFLEFLRNLTPQILFLTMALILGTRIDLSKFEFSFAGAINFFPFGMCMVIFFGSFIANITLFLDSAITSTENLDKQVEMIANQKINSLKKSWLLIKAAWKFNKPVFLKLCW